MDLDLEFSSLKTLRRLKVLEEKGRGAYGAVFSAESNDTEKQLICKRLHDILVGRGKEERVSSDERTSIVSKFMKECVILSKLKHRNVVQFYAVHIGEEGTQKGDIGLVMEALWIDLHNAACTHTHCEKLSYVRKLSILRDVSCGLAYLHNSNVIHRDLNTGNVLVSKDLAVAKIADLGCFKMFNPADVISPPMSTCPGHQDFMPPEALLENPSYDQKLDCFSFGHLTLCLWNRSPPILGGNITENDLACKQQQIGRRRASLKCLEKYPDLSKVITDCLLDECDKRPSSKDIHSFFNKKIGGCVYQALPLELPTQNCCSIAVDFGTQMLRAAYCLEDGEVKVVPLHENCSEGTPNVLLIKNNECTGLTEAEIGHNALNQYYRQAVCTTLNHVCYYFNLEDCEVPALIKGSDGKQYLTVEVIAVILTCIGKKVRNFLTIRGKHNCLEKFQYVLTISASWGKSSRSIMRKAACLATVYLNGERSLSLPLSSVNSVTSQNVQVKISDKICFIPKSEAAATTVLLTEIQPQFNNRPSNSCFLIVDVGEGTIEVSSIVYRNGKYQILKLPHHNHEGAAMVSKAFFKHLAHEILNDDDFCRYFSHEERGTHYADLHVAFSESFEQAKITFASYESNLPDHFTVNMPPSLFEVYEQQVKQLGEHPHIQMRRQKLEISSSKFDELLAQCFYSIKAAIDNAVAAVDGRPIAALYLLGGLGGSQYIVDKVRSCYSAITSVIVPDNHMLATVHGACHYFNESSPTHISTMNYGIGCLIPYDDSHQQGEKLLSEDDKYYCSSVFVPLLCKDEPINPLKVHRCVLTPMYHGQSILTVSLYSTSLDNSTLVVNIDTGDVMEGVTELSSIDVDIEAGMNTLSLQERQVEVTVRFRRCEIIVTTEYNGCNKTCTIVNM